MDLSTLIIEETLRAFLATVYSSLLREYTFFTIAMAVSFVIFPIFAARTLYLDVQRVEAVNVYGRQSQS